MLPVFNFGFTGQSDRFIRSSCRQSVSLLYLRCSPNYLDRFSHVNRSVLMFSLDVGYDTVQFSSFILLIHIKWLENYLTVSELGQLLYLYCVAFVVLLSFVFTIFLQDPRFYPECPFVWFICILYDVQSKFYVTSLSTYFYLLF